MIFSPDANLVLLSNPHSGVEQIEEQLKRLSVLPDNTFVNANGFPWPLRYLPAKPADDIFGIGDGFGVVATVRNPYDRFVEAYLYAQPTLSLPPLDTIFSVISPLSIRSDYRLAGFLPQHLYVVLPDFFAPVDEFEQVRTQSTVVGSAIRYEFLTSDAKAVFDTMGLYLSRQLTQPVSIAGFAEAKEALFNLPEILSFVSRLYLEDFVLLGYDLADGVDLTPALSSEIACYGVSPLWHANVFNSGIASLPPSSMPAFETLAREVESSEMPPFVVLDDIFKIGNQHNAYC